MDSGSRPDRVRTAPIRWVLAAFLAAAPAQGDTLLCISTIDGPIPNPLQPSSGCVEVLGFSQELLSDQGTVFGGSLKVLKRTDQTTPLLFEKAATGEHLTEVRLTLVAAEAGGALYAPYEILLEPAVITSVSQTGGEGFPAEQVEITPLKDIRWIYRPIDESGAFLPPVEREIDISAINP